MSRIASFFVLASAAVTVLSVAACDSGEIAVGRSQQLVTRKDGQPTGNGHTCSWDDTVAYDAVSGKQTTAAAPNGPYKVGDTFPSLDGCNDCSCTKDGIMCTERSCNNNPGQGQACTDDAKICPDGSSVGRTGPNCEFAPCPGEDRCELPFVQGPCEAAIDVFWYNASTGKCEPRMYGGCEGNENRFATEKECVAACAGSSGGDTVCPDDAIECPDGTWVGRSGPSCEFVCP